MLRRLEVYSQQFCSFLAGHFELCLCSSVAPVRDTLHEHFVAAICDSFYGRLPLVRFAHSVVHLGLRSSVLRVASPNLILGMRQRANACGGGTS